MQMLDIALGSHTLQQKGRLFAVATCHLQNY